jgi:hypothetical protein
MLSQLNARYLPMEFGINPSYNLWKTKKLTETFNKNQTNVSR